MFIRGALFFICSLVCLTSIASAQNLNGQINSALGNNCSGLFSDSERSKFTLEIEFGGGGGTPIFLFDPLLAINYFEDTNNDGVIDDQITLPAVFIDPTDVANLNLPFDFSPFLEGLEFSRGFSGLNSTVVNEIDVTLPSNAVAGAGLAEICASVFAFNQNNSNATLTQGLATGVGGTPNAPAASSRSARDRAAAAKKKRKKKKTPENERRESYLQLASLGDNTTLIGEALFGARDNPFLYVDISGGFVNVDRTTTILENGFDGRARWAAARLFAPVTDWLMLTGDFEYSRLSGEFVSNNGPNGDMFSREGIGGAVYLVGEFRTPVPNAELTIAIGGFYEGGDSDQTRSFSIVSQSVIGDFLGAGIPSFVQSRLFEDQLGVRFSDRVVGYSASAILDISFDGLVLSPFFEASSFHFRQKEAIESSIDGHNDGFGLRYRRYTDQWSEYRIGALAQTLISANSNGSLVLSVSADAVFTGNARTPDRSASFAQDLRNTPFIFNYAVDDRVKRYGEISVELLFDFDLPIQPYIGGFALVGNELFDVFGFGFGVRFAN